MYPSLDIDVPLSFIASCMQNTQVYLDDAGIAQLSTRCEPELTVVYPRIRFIYKNQTYLSTKYNISLLIHRVCKTKN